MHRFTTLLYYKFTKIENPQEVMKWQKALCYELNLKGRIIINHEGLNGTVEGLNQDISLYKKAMSKNPLFNKIHWKSNFSDGSSFPKMSIKVRDELVTTGLKTGRTSPLNITGKYLSPEELHSWFLNKKKFYIVDMRNDYENMVGHFVSSIPSGMQTFKDLPKVLPKIEHLKNETILTVCTGGIRCELATGFLINNGFNDVYQLSGGIISYMEKYPNQNFLGKLYVFDNRILVGFNTDSPDHKIVGKCKICNNFSENYVDGYFDGIRTHTIVCNNCANNLEIQSKYQLELLR